MRRRPRQCSGRSCGRRADDRRRISSQHESGLQMHCDNNAPLVDAFRRMDLRRSAVGGMAVTHKGILFSFPLATHCRPTACPPTHPGPSHHSPVAATTENMRDDKTHHEYAHACTCAVGTGQATEMFGGSKIPDDSSILSFDVGRIIGFGVYPPSTSSRRPHFAPVACSRSRT